MNEWQRFFKSVGYAANGIFYTIRTQRNMQIHVCFAVVVVPLSFILPLDMSDVILVLFSVFLVLIAELINTALESAVDLVTQEHRPLAKAAKDAAAGAVLLAAILSVIIGITVLGPPLLAVLAGG